jgi:threonine synthase
VTAVSDDEIMEAKAEIDAAGVGCEPASAASVAGVRKLVGTGEIRSSDRVLAVLTGHVLKDPGILLWYHEELKPHPERANRPVEIPADIREVERFLRR